VAGLLPQAAKLNAVNKVIVIPQNFFIGIASISTLIIPAGWGLAYLSLSIEENA
jgi:hypothetical protein